MKRKTTGIVAILLIASMTLWAADTSELRGKFTDSLANGNLEEAISNYDEMVSQAGKDYQKAQRSYEKALEAGNKPKAMEAWRDMHSSYYMAMTRDETDDMLALILAEDEDARIEDAKWLEANSRYYSPSITYEWSSSGDNYSFRASLSFFQIKMISACQVQLVFSLAGVSLLMKLLISRARLLQHLLQTRHFMLSGRQKLSSRIL